MSAPKRMCKYCGESGLVGLWHEHNRACKRWLINCPVCLRRHPREEQKSIACVECKEMICKPHVEEHQRSECRRRKIECPYCKEQILVVLSEEHYRDECFDCPRPCERCGEKATRREANDNPQNHDCIKNLYQWFKASEQQLYCEIERLQERIRNLENPY